MMNTYMRKSVPIILEGMLRSTIIEVGRIVEKAIWNLIVLCWISMYGTM